MENGEKPTENQLNTVKNARNLEKIALFPGSFDPFTLGHLAVAERGLTLFDRVVIGVGTNTDKREGMLTPEKRKALIDSVFSSTDIAREGRIEAVVYDCLTGEFCRRHGIKHILRGIRNSADFEYEHSMEMAGTMLYPEITTVAIFTPAEYIPVSSRLVREIITMGGDPAPFLPHGVDIKKYL